MCNIWADVLEVDKVGIHDNFFDLGGYSLLGILLFARIKEQWGRSLPISTLFQAPTVAQLAAALQQASGQQGLGFAGTNPKRWISIALLLCPRLWWRRPWLCRPGSPIRTGSAFLRHTGQGARRP